MSRTDKTRPYAVAKDDTTLPGYISHDCGTNRTCDYRPDGNQVNFKLDYRRRLGLTGNAAAINCTRDLYLPLSGYPRAKAWKRLWNRAERREMNLRLHAATFDPDGFNDQRRGQYRDIMSWLD